MGAETNVFEDENLMVLTAKVVRMGADAAEVRTRFAQRAVLPFSEISPASEIRVDSNVIVGLDLSCDPPRASQSSPSVVSALFAGVVPELAEGAVRIMGVAREPGVKTKVAVASTVENIDPRLVMVGVRGNRVREVSRWLSSTVVTRGRSGDVARSRQGVETIDVVLYHPDPLKYLSYAFAPAEVTAVRISPEGEALVYVPESQIPTAIGTGGLNSKLAGFLADLDPKVVSDDLLEEEGETDDSERT